MAKRSWNPEWDHHTVINEDTWDRMLLLAKVVYHRNPEADLFDVFNLWREHYLGGWYYTDTFLDKLDKEIEEEFAGQ